MIHPMGIVITVILMACTWGAFEFVIYCLRKDYESPNSSLRKMTIFMLGQLLGAFVMLGTGFLTIVSLIGWFK